MRRRRRSGPRLPDGRALARRRVLRRHRHIPRGAGDAVRHPDLAHRPPHRPGRGRLGRDVRRRAPQGARRGRQLDERGPARLRTDAHRAAAPGPQGARRRKSLDPSQPARHLADHWVVTWRRWRRTAAEPDGSFRRLTGHAIGWIYIASGLVIVGYAPSVGTARPVVVSVLLGLGAATMVGGVVMLRLPWHRWRRGWQVLAIPPSLAISGFGNWLDPNPYLA